MIVGHIDSVHLAKIDVNAQWDAEAKVWVASSDDLPRLVTEADTLEELQQKLAVMIPELLEANNAMAENDVGKIPVNLIAHLAMIGKPPAGASSSTRGLRERELEWRRTHPETLGQFENEWVVLEGEEIIAHGFDAAKVIEEARAKGIKIPYVFFVEPKNENVITIGL
jgi:predicted RNase H-like HicB family nuclease